MPTLGEACQQLRIGRVTLAKWIKRLGIETTRHEWDYRYEVIAPEDVERIAEARRKLPQASGRPPMIPSYSSLAFDRRQSERETVSDAPPTVTPMSRQRAMRRVASSGLPDGMMSRSDVADLHNFPASTLRRWCDEGRIETDGGVYGGEHGQFQAARPVTPRGLRQFYALACSRTDFRACPSCPHDEEEARDESLQGDSDVSRA